MRTNDKKKRRLSLKQAAALSDGLRRDCKKCNYWPCNPTLCKFCGDTYKAGFVKGVKYQNKNQKEKSK